MAGMCVVALARHVHPDWPLILVGNRDEFHARAAAPLAEWGDGSGIIAGRDLQAGGTWLGVHPASGRVVVVTNVRGAPSDPGRESRGELVADLLRGDGRFADPQCADLDRFNAFNLLTVDRGGARLLTNRPEPRVEMLTTGIHALANEPTDSPCARATRLRAALASATAAAADPETLLDMLVADDAPALFLHGEAYGTRCSTLVAIAADGRAHMVERRYEAGGRPIGTTALDFRTGF